MLHGDGDRTNNALDNLRYGAPVENSADAELHGRVARGEKHGNALIDEEAVRYMRAMKGQTSQRELAKRFGLTSRTAVSLIQNRHRWAHV